MITFFNRFEAALTLSDELGQRIAYALEDAGIDYIRRTVGITRPSPLPFRTRSKTGSAAECPTAFEYYFFVNKKDGQRAKDIIDALKR